LSLSLGAKSENIFQLSSFLSRNIKYSKHCNAPEKCHKSCISKETHSYSVPPSRAMHDATNRDINPYMVLLRDFSFSTGKNWALACYLVIYEKTAKVKSEINQQTPASREQVWSTQTGTKVRPLLLPVARSVCVVWYIFARALFRLAIYLILCAASAVCLPKKAPWRAPRVPDPSAVLTAATQLWVFANVKRQPNL
jgi:hypothetical protein